MARYPNRPVRRVVRWYTAYLPLGVAVAAVILAATVYAGGGNKWCADNAYSCSIQTDLVGVVAIGGATTYWYYGFRRDVLLRRYRRRLRTHIKSNSPDGGPIEAHGDVTAGVLAAHRRWRNPPRVTLLTGPAGSGKRDIFVRTISALTGPWNWSVPVPLGEVTTGSPEDLLDSAKRQLELILLDANANQDLIDSLWHSLLRCGRLLFIADDIEEIAPSISSAERELVVQRMFLSAERLGVPLLGTGKPDLLDSAPGLVLELSRISDDVARGWLARAARLDEAADTHLAGAVVGPLATSSMIERLVWLLRRSGDSVLAALERAHPDVRGLVLWDHLLAEHVVPDAAIPARELRILAFALLRKGRLEVEVPDSSEWEAAVTLADEVGARLRSFGPNETEVRSYVAGGFLEPSSNRRLLRFSSPEVQATLAAGFLADQPGRVAEIVGRLGTSAAAREALAGALRLDVESGRVHGALLAALGGQVSAASEAAGLCLAIRHPPAVFGAGLEADLASRLSLTLADRVAGAAGPVLGLAGLRDAVTTLDQHVARQPERYLLQALHSSSFQVRLAVALALLRRRRPQAVADTVETWIATAESPSADGVQHQLGLALWFCPYLRETDPDDRGGQLYQRGLRLATAADANPLMFETSLCRGFKLAAWVHPERPVDPALLDLLDAAPRFWYSRVSIVHALGTRLASTGTTDGSIRARALAALHHAAEDPHPLAAEAARLTLDGLAGGRPAASFAWLAETDMARSNSQLDDQPQRLLGDVSLLLNLTYCAEPWPDPVWEYLATSNGLPDCIRQPAERETFIRHGCPPHCPFQLCPYPGPSRRGRGRGELSGMFCRAQADLATQLPRAPWHEGGNRRQAAEFWLYAEDNLANRDGWEINL